MSRTTEHIARLERALVIAARVVQKDEAALPVFARIDCELQAAKMIATAECRGNPIAIARAKVQARMAA